MRNTRKTWKKKSNGINFKIGDGGGMKFKVGDIVKGNRKADSKYEITTSYCTGEVIEVYGDGTILLKVISHEIYGVEAGHKFDVEEDYFDLVTQNGWTGLYNVAYYEKLFTIENNVPVVNNVSKDSPCYKQLCAEYKNYLKKEKENKVCGIAN